MPDIDIDNLQLEDLIQLIRQTPAGEQLQELMSQISSLESYSRRMNQLDQLGEALKAHGYDEQTDVHEAVALLMGGIQTDLKDSYHQGPAKFQEINRRVAQVINIQRALPPEPA